MEDWWQEGFIKDDVPTVEEKRMLIQLLESSTLKPYQRKIAFEQISLCEDYKTYQQLQFRLEELQPSIDEIPNPNQTDIKNHLRKLS